MANNNFYRYGLYQKLLGLDPNPPTSLSKLLGLDPPPAPSSTGLSAILGLPAPPAPVPAPTGIQIQDRYFSEPTAFGTAWLPKSSGIYAILVPDWTWGPRPYRPIYFGKAGDLAGRVGTSHEKYGEWCRAAGGADKLYVAYHLMPRAGNAQLVAIEESLIKHYSPECNKTFNYLASLLGY